MNRLMENTVFPGLVTARRLATYNQVLARLGERHNRRRQAPALGLVITTGSPPSITATTELVVPRSMPMILLHAAITREFDQQ